MKLWTNMSGPDPAAVEARYNEWRVEVGYLFSPLTLTNDLTWTLSKVDAAIAALPSGDLTGVPFVADWEGAGLTVLAAGSGDPQHAAVLAQWISLAQYVKAQRSDVAFGYYTIPFRNYWDQDQDWIDSIDDLDTLYPEVGALYPSVYDFYGCSTDPDHGNFQCARDLTNFGNIVRKALEKSVTHGNGIPVYPYFHDRYHNSTAEWGFKRIPDLEFRDHIRHLAFGVNYEGRMIDGAVAWGSDRSQYLHAFATSSPGACGYGDGLVDVCTNGWARARVEFSAEMDAEGLDAEPVSGTTLDAYETIKQPQVYAAYCESLGLCASGIEAVASACRARWRTEVALQHPVTTIYDNDPTDPPEPDGTTDKWVRFRVKPDTNDQTTFGSDKTWHMSGRAIAECYVRVGTGTSGVNALVEDAMTPFRSVTASGIRFTYPTPHEVGRAGPWWQVNVILPWYTDVSA